MRAPLAPDFSFRFAFAANPWYNGPTCEPSFCPWFVLSATMRREETQRATNSRFRPREYSLPIGFLFLPGPALVVASLEFRMLVTGYLVLAAALLVGAIAAVLSKAMIRAAVALGLGSVSLAALFFMLGAPHAGGFELSVGAGLISVLFILAISLTESMGRTRRES
jgi:uncharacterized MnhB-related membrane protein